jgi:hypothetical protein
MWRGAAFAQKKSTANAAAAAELLGWQGYYSWPAAWQSRRHARRLSTADS